MKQSKETTQKGKILLLKLHGQTLCILICGQRILSVQVCEEQSRQIGNIYVGRVQNVAPNIEAAFVEIRKGVQTFLPYKEAVHAFVTNRRANGQLRPGDELLVQLSQKPIKTKLAGVSTKLSLPGTYVVVSRHGSKTTSGALHVSARLGAKYSHLYKKEETLQRIAQKYDVIIRTNAAAAKDVSVVCAEAEALAGQLDHILKIGDKRTCFSCLYQSEPDYLTYIRNVYQSEYDEIVTDDHEIYESLLGAELTRDLSVRFYEDALLPLYKLYSIETRLQELLSKKVWLGSGAYLVIEQTEALYAIDVNTGKYEQGKAQEETYLKINLEAAEEIAHQLRARNLSGMILVDFINMKETEHQELLLRTMKELLRHDPITAHVVDITGLGLVEITRQKQLPSLAEQMKK